MFFGLAILATALLLSAVAAYYSVAGLVAIFSAATIPVIIMGGSLELGKIVATVWLHQNWRRAGLAFKMYLVPAIAFLMLLTSMGIFGYLSKAHSDQNLISGDSQARIAIYDEKIKTARENIEADRRQLRQMDEAVDQVMARSTTEEGASKSNAIRRAQARDRTALAKNIEANQKIIATLNEEAAPIRAEVRKVEAEVGPIKYIAALIYGDNPDANLLERSVRWMIIMIVLVFDPLALTLILAANKQFEWVRQGQGGWTQHAPQYPADDGPLTDSQITQLQKDLDLKRAVAQALDNEQDLPAPTENVTVAEQPHHPDTHPYLRQGFRWPPGWQFVKALVASSNIKVEDDELDTESNQAVKQAMKAWKADNPTGSLKEQRKKLARGEIDELPWLTYLPPQDTFGPEFAPAQRKGDTHVLTRNIPHSLYKWNGNAWIAIDKTVNHSYTNNKAYVSYLIDKLNSGEYDQDYLTDSEREQVVIQLSQGPA